jgi:hypothetical protein
VNPSALASQNLSQSLVLSVIGKQPENAHRWETGTRKPGQAEIILLKRLQQRVERKKLQQDCLRQFLLFVLISTSLKTSRPVPRCNQKGTLGMALAFSSRDMLSFLHFVSNTRFAVVAEGLYDRKIEFIAAGNVYYTRQKELNWLLKAAEKEGFV